MGKLQFSATERVKFKAQGVRNESGEAGRNQISAGQICYIEASGLSPAGTVKAKDFKQGNDVILYPTLIQIIFSEFQIRSTKLMSTILVHSEFYQNASKGSITIIKYISSLHFLTSRTVYCKLYYKTFHMIEKCDR